MTVTHEINVDVQQENTQAIRIPQYNKDTHILKITLTDNGQAISLTTSGYNAFMKIAGAAGNFYNLTATIASTGVITFTIPESVTAFPGRHKAQLDVMESATTARLCSMPFILLVTPSVYSDDEVIASNEYTSLTDLLAQAQELMNRMTSKLNQIDRMYTNMYKYRGSVASYEALPVKNVEMGDVYNTELTGMNYAWNGSAWDALGQAVDTDALWKKEEMTLITTAQIDAMFS